MDLSQAPVTYALILVNIVISLYALFVNTQFTDQFGFHVGAVRRQGEHFRVFTSSFLHVNLFHLLFNMVALFSFGPTVERLLGKLGFIVVYFGAILVSGIVSTWVNRHNLTYRSIGASDAVSGVIFAFVLFFPLAPILVFPIPFGIPAILFGVAFLMISSLLMGAENRMIAHEGHLGGAVGGLILTVMMRPDAIAIFLGQIFSR